MAGITMRVNKSKNKKIDKGALRKYVHEQLKTLWRDCVRAFITEAVKHVNVETGMSEASFYDLATNVKVASQVIADIMGKGPVPPRTPYTDIKGVVHPKVKKSIPLGRELGGRKAAYKLLFGSPNNPKLVFAFNIVIYQYKLHEFGYTDRWNHTHTAWNSLEHGRLAFIECWNTNFSRRITARKIYEFLAPR